MRQTGKKGCGGPVEDAESAARPKYCTHQGANTVQCLHGLLHSRFYCHECFSRCAEDRIS